MHIQLSRKTRLYAQAKFILAMTYNPVGAAFCVGAIIFLFALHLGASNLQMGILFAAMHMSALGTFISPPFLNGSGATATFRRFFWLRTVVIIGYFLIPFMAKGNSQVWLLIAIYFSFLTLRSIGMSTNFFLSKAITDKREYPGLQQNYSCVFTSAKSSQA